MAMLSVSALRRFSAISKDVLVRVLGLEEQVDDGLSSQRRNLLDRAQSDLLHRLRGVEDERNLLGRKVRDAKQVPAPQRRRGRTSAGVRLDGPAHAAPPLQHHFIPIVALLQADLDALLRRGRQILADVVGLDGKLAVAAVDQHDQLNAAWDGRSRSGRRGQPASFGPCTARRPPAESSDRRWRTKSPCGGRAAAAPRVGA